MIALRGRSASVELVGSLPRRMWRIVEASGPPGDRATSAVVLGKGDTAPPDYPLYLLRPGVSIPASGRSWITLPAPLQYLASGDVVSVTPDGKDLHVLWRANSRQNSVLLTERCDNYCLMCSQPPREREDSWLLAQAVELMSLVPSTTTDINFTGGEPTLYGEGLVDLLRLCGDCLPEADVHLLSNGRRFADKEFAVAYSNIGNQRLMVGIPLYGGEASLHDFVVQAPGAFNETVAGILNLARLGQRIELRIVVHKQTAPDLISIAEFIVRNLPFVEQVAIMGLEMMGLARANIETVWIDPIDYKAALSEAALILHQSGIRTMIYNHQLCLMERRAWRFAVKSISDWKNEYHDECARCTALDSCGGMFSSAKYKSSPHLSAISDPRAVSW